MCAVGVTPDVTPNLVPELVLKSLIDILFV